jgi:hypothetical protein
MDLGGGSMKRMRTLLLNANYQPRSIIPLERAFALMFEDESLGGGIGKVHTVLTAADVETGEIPDNLKYWHSATQAFAVPIVMALRQMRSPLFDLPNVGCETPNLRAVKRRDHGCCLYCLRTEDELEQGNFLTMDHIIPRCRFDSPQDAHYYENIALSCLSCNLFKAGRTPEEAGMTLHGVPIRPSAWDLAAVDLMECQRAFVRWCRDGGPVPEGLLVAA